MYIKAAAAALPSSLSRLMVSALLLRASRIPAALTTAGGSDPSSSVIEADLLPPLVDVDEDGVC